MIDRRSVVVLFMGDSITDGQYVDTSIRWTNLVSSFIDLKYLETPHNILFVNKGVSGETTRQGLERYATDVQQNYPDILTIQFGLNDCNCWITDRGAPRVSEKGFDANLREMIDRARRFNVYEIILMTMHRTMRHKVLVSGESLEQRRIRYNEIIRKVASDEKIFLCDIESYFLKYTEREMNKLLLPYPDVLHLSIDGHKVYEDIMKPVIENSIEKYLSSNGVM